MLVKLEGYAPDADPTEKGIFTDCFSLLPSLKGYRAAPSAESTGVTALTTPCLGAAALRKLDESIRYITGSQTQLYELSGTSFVDRSQTAGYTLSSSDRWRFSQFGDVSLAVAKTENLQASSSGAFAKAGAAAPKAALVEVVGQFVMLANTNETTYGNSPSRWWCSAIGDYTDWVPAVATQCATGLVTSSPGKITALKRLGDQVIAYKQRSMFRGVYQGSPVVWEFSEIASGVGALSHEAVVNIGTPEDPQHIFMGYQDFYIFDGSAPVSIGKARINETVFGELNRDYAEYCIALHDSARSLVFFYYPKSATTQPDRCVVYNYKTRKWGRDNRTIQAAFEYIQPSLTYASLGTAYTTYASLVSESYDSSAFAASAPLPAVFDSTNTFVTLTGTPTSWGYTTGDLGDDNIEVFVSRVKPRFITAPQSGQQINYYRQNNGDALEVDSTVTMTDSRFDILREARWHRFAHSFIGDGEITALDIQHAPGGNE